MAPAHLVVLFGLAALAACASARTAVCYVDSEGGYGADFKTLKEALYGCGGEGVRSIKLVINGVFDEGHLAVPEHLSSVSITSFERNLDLANKPRIVGSFELTRSGEMAFELSHVVLDGRRAHPAIFYQTEPGAATWFERFTMLGCVVRGYTNPPYVNVKTTSDDKNVGFIAGNAVVSEPDSSEAAAAPDLGKAIPFPWTLQRAAAYAAKAEQEGGDEPNKAN